MGDFVQFKSLDLKPHLLYILCWQVGSLPLAPPGKPNTESTAQFGLAIFQGLRGIWKSSEYATPIILSWKQLKKK